MTNTQNNDPLVVVRGLKKYFPIQKGWLGKVIGYTKAVDGVDLTIKHGETMGLVGESGCGKSTLGRTIIRLYEPSSGEILFKNTDISSYTRRQMRPLQQRMQIIFQDPFSSMNPGMKVKRIVAEPIIVQQGYEKTKITQQVGELLERVGLKPSCMDRYPHEFSGGQRQRIATARALALNPDFIVCDEPVSSLDVSIRAQIINLLVRLQRELGLTYLFISHDLAVVRHIADRVAVMYLGKIVELADRDSIYDLPLHPYTIALLHAIPIPDPIAEKAKKPLLLQGDLPNPLAINQGCRFQPRCPKAISTLCDQIEPELIEHSPGHWVACHLHEISS